MKGNPTAGILLLVLASLFIVLGTKYKDNVRGAWVAIRGGSTAPNTTQEGIEKIDATGSKIKFKDGSEIFVGNKLKRYFDIDQKKWIDNPNYKP